MDHIDSVSMKLVPHGSRPTMYLNFGYSGKGFVCRDANVVGHFMSEFGAFLGSDRVDTMQVTCVDSSDKTHIIAFDVQTSVQV